MKYYSTTAIDKKNATYNMIFGERSNGKSYALIKKAVKNYWENGKQSAIIRRWKEDITGRRASRVFEGLIANDEVSKITKGKFKGIHYWAGKWYLCNYDEENGKPIYAEQDIFCFAFALSDAEHEKSTSFPNVDLIIFDEFLTNRLYLNDEFLLFMNVVSTIVRRREDVKIYMLGNTVNKYCPYFSEMGLTNIQTQKQGTIDVYAYGDSSLTVAVEYCASMESQTNKGAKKYFAFNNPKLQMITGGAWELSLYPHCPLKYKPKNIDLIYFIEFNDMIFQCEIVTVDGNSFTYIHQKTTPIKNVDTDLIYSLASSHKPNYNTSVFKTPRKIHKRILWYFLNDKVFYQDNSVGDAIANYLKICKTLRV